MRPNQRTLDDVGEITRVILAEEASQTLRLRESKL